MKNTFNLNFRVFVPCFNPGNPGLIKLAQLNQTYKNNVIPARILQCNLQSVIPVNFGIPLE